MRFTVFTPCYNRAYIIKNLYNSLQRQTFRDFEWLVIDDGSTDGTNQLFEKILSENPFFPIRYIKTENGGKHRAINRGVLEAEGELFFIVDSDDYLTDDALSIADRVERSIPTADKQSFAGICGQKGKTYEHGVGSTYSGNDFLDITMLERPQYNITGDKAEIFYTDILRKYPFPEFEGENFVTECVVWDQIAYDGFKLRFFNDIIYICDYLPDGLTAKGKKLFRENPKGHGLYIYLCDKHGKMLGLSKWNEYLDYFYAHRNQYSFFEISRNLHMNPVRLWVRLFGMRLFYKIYS